MHRYECNDFGREKAQRFRARFGLIVSPRLDATNRRYLDAHDYLHTVAGALPNWGGDEERVVRLEERIAAGLVALPRGLREV